MASTVIASLVSKWPQVKWYGARDNVCPWFLAPICASPPSNGRLGNHSQTHTLFRTPSSILASPYGPRLSPLFRLFSCNSQPGPRTCLNGNYIGGIGSYLREHDRPSLFNMKGSKEAPISLDSDEDDWPVQYELGSDGELVEVIHRPRSSEKSTGRSQQQQQHQNQQQPPPNSVEHRLADQKPGLKHSTATTWNTSPTSIKTDGHPVPPANLEQTPTFTQKLGMPRVVQGDGQHLGVVAPQQNRSASLPSENIEVTKCPAPPIGTRAGPQCEQTTFQRVEIAKPCPRRVTTDEEAFGSKTVRKPFNKVRKSTGSNLAKKSALSDPRRRKTTFQSTKRTARFPEAGNRPESSGRSSSTDTEDSFPVQNPPGLSKSAVVVDASSTTRTPTTVCSTTGAYGSANKKQNVMGAHVSTSAHSPSAVASHQQRISPKLHAHSMSVTGADHIPKIDSIASNMRDANQAALEIVETAIHLHDPGRSFITYLSSGCNLEAWQHSECNLLSIS